jgi:gamma-glutamyltranspeptidase/glutathione hydrolase
MRAPSHAAAILLAAAMAVVCALPAAWARTPQAAEDLNPEAASGTRDRQLARAPHFMMVSANPLATQAGDEMLRRGGSVVDAAIATQMVLNLVEPQSSGIGGGAFMVLYSARTGRIQTYDSRETAPAAARQDRFLDAQGKPLPFAQAVNNGMSVGVPAALGRPVPARDPAGGAGLRRVAAPARAAGRQQGAARATRGGGLFLRARRRALAGWPRAEEP